MLFWAAFLILLGLLGLGVTGIVLVFQISEMLAEVDAEAWRR